ncbi:hypothetical protein M3699_01270 [Peribacillus simplex]|nr:hypothetical protein [Peribacillus simplex]MCM3672536.1 hypothetical protein [Peribacillus simplex]
MDTEEYGEKSFGLGIVSVKKPQFLERLGGNLPGLPKNFNALGVTEDLECRSFQRNDGSNQCSAVLSISIPDGNDG